MNLEQSAAAELPLDRPDRIDNTYSAFHARAEGLEWWPEGGGGWFIYGHEEVAAATRDDDAFSSRHDLPNGATPFIGVMTPPTPMEAIPIEVDPPAHEKFRRVISRRLTARAVSALYASIYGQAEGLLLQAASRGNEIDFFHDFVKLIPARITLEFLGLGSAEAAQVADGVHVRGDERFDMVGPWPGLIEAIVDNIERRRREPSDDLLTDLCTAAPLGLPLLDDDIIKIVLTLVIGGISTSTKATLGAIWHLSDLEARRKLIEDREKLDVAIEEWLRFFSPVPFLARTATRDIEVAGKVIKEGDRVFLGWGAANRDPALFECPNEVNIERTPNKHLAMGIGAHYCVGASLGRAEMRGMVGALLDHFPQFTVLDGASLPGRLAVRPASLPGTLGLDPREP